MVDELEQTKYDALLAGLVSETEQLIRNIRRIRRVPFFGDSFFWGHIIKAMNVALPFMRFTPIYR
jgi:hypothetical protein